PQRGGPVGGDGRGEPAGRRADRPDAGRPPVRLPGGGGRLGLDLAGEPFPGRLAKAEGRRPDAGAGAGGGGGGRSGGVTTGSRRLSSPLVIAAAILFPSPVGRLPSPLRVGVRFGRR